MPAAGGSYSEGIIGSPRYLNPVLAPTNEADRNISRIVFSSLLKYGGQGQLIPDLAENYAIGDFGKVYDFFIRKDAFWHDKKQLTADDVVFTLQIIKDPDFRSPLRNNWVGVDVEKIDDFTVRFKLKNPYAAFPYNITFGILPKHIWQNIPASDFALSEKNLKPIGSGPYLFKKLEKNKDGSIKMVELEAFKKYYFEGPYLEKLIFRFYQDEEAAISAWKKSEIQSLSYLSPKNYSLVKNKQSEDLNIHNLILPRYFSLFFNQSQHKALADKNVRMALAHGIDKDLLVEKALGGFGQKVDSPLLAGMLGYSEQVKIYEFNPEKANELLNAAGWIDQNGDGIKEKEGQNLEFTLLTIPWPELSQTANILKELWQNIGVKINVEIKDITSLQQENIKPRQYQILLFGELLSVEPDPFSFWHSSQKKDPGLNIALYENPQVDAILQDARQDLDPASRAKKYEQFSQIIAEDLPAIFLYSPAYLYPISSEIKGAEFKILNMPSDRFSQIEKWYVKTKRVWKKD